MADDMQRGADAFLALSRRLKAAGRGDLRKELNKDVQAAAKPLIPKVRAAARTRFPQRGGLAQRMAKKPLRTQARTGELTAGVRIVGTKVDPRIDREGRVQHPVFGRTGSRVVQRVPGARGYFSDTMQAGAPEVREEVVKRLGAFVERLAHGGPGPL